MHTFGVVLSSAYTMLSAAMSSTTSAVIRVMVAWSVVTWWMRSNSWKHSDSVRLPARKVYCVAVQRLLRAAR